jgi:hypothetical protein
LGRHASAGSFFGLCHLCMDLFWVGIPVGKLLAFMIPPIFLACLFEMVYWRTRWKERQKEYEKYKK